MWLSIMPPAVGSGCRQIKVATGGRSSGWASSPTRSRPSAVRSTMSSRRAGSTVLALMSWLFMYSSPVTRWPARPALPACIVPVPALQRSRRLGGPDHHVRGSGPDLLIAAGAAVLLGGGRAGHGPDHPVAVRPFLRLRRPEPDGRLIVARLSRRRAAGLARPARLLAGQAAGLPRAH